MRFAALLAGTLLTGAGSCSGATAPVPTPEPTQEAPPVETPEAETQAAPIPVAARADFKPARGKLIEVTGAVRREKPGDSVAGADFDLLCPDFRFPDEKQGASVTVRGTLDKVETPAAEVGPNGEISQGPGVATTRWVLLDCVLQ